MDVKRNEHTSEFMAAFFAFGPAVELLKKVERNVSGADFGHSTSPGALCQKIGRASKIRLA